MTDKENIVKNIINKQLVNENQQTNKENIIKQYEILVNSAQEISNQRENTNKFYLTLIAALFSIGTYLSTTYNKLIIIILLIFIILIGIRWKRHLQEYEILNSTKFEIINKLELYLPVKVFTTEWEILKQKNYTGLTKWNKKIPLWIIIISIIWIVLIINDKYNIINLICSYL